MKLHHLIAKIDACNPFCALWNGCFWKSMLRGSYNRTRLGHFVAMVPVTLSFSANPYFVAGPVCHSVKSCNYFPRRTKLETFCQKLNRDLIQFPILGFFVQKKILSFWNMQKWYICKIRCDFVVCGRIRFW